MEELIPCEGCGKIIDATIPVEKDLLQQVIELGFCSVECIEDKIEKN